MTSLRPRRAVDWLVAVLALAAAGIVHALEPADVLTPLSHVERSDATFEETRHIAALTAPVVRRGSLHYVRPAELTMVVDSPVRERLRIVGGTLTLEGRGGTREIRITDMPVVAALVESIRGTLAGDPAALGRYFTVRASGEAARWRLELTPLTTELATAVSRITIEGADTQIGRIDVNESSGDRSVMLIAPAARKP